MSTKRKKYNSKLKAEIALEAIKETQSQSNLVSNYGVHASQIKTWKEQGIKAIQDFFSKKLEKTIRAQEKLLADLYQEIGQLQTQLRWVKKKCARHSGGEAGHD